MREWKTLIIQATECYPAVWMLVMINVANVFLMQHFCDTILFPGMYDAVLVELPWMPEDDLQKR